MNVFESASLSAKLLQGALFENKVHYSLLATSSYTMCICCNNPKVMKSLRKNFKQ